MLVPKKDFSKMFIWYGSGANGKSLLLKLMKKIMGNFMTHANILTINENFALQSVVNGICNVTDDVGVTTIKETGLLKSVIQGSTIEVNRKYRDSIEWQPNSQFVICCNEVPRIEDTTPGMLRRLEFVPFELQLSKDKQDINLENELISNIDNLRYILTGGIFAYREAVNRGYLTETKKQKDLIDDFQEENKRPIDLFFEYLIEQQGSLDNLCKFLDGTNTNEIYKKYQEFREGDKNIEIQKTFTGRFKRLLPSKIELVRHSLGGISFTTYTLK